MFSFFEASYSDRVCLTRKVIIRVHTHGLMHGNYVHLCISLAIYLIWHKIRNVFKIFVDETLGLITSFVRPLWRAIAVKG